MKISHWIFFLCVVLGTSYVSANSSLEKLQHGPDWNYQTIIVNGREVLQSTNASGGSQAIYDRYEAIKQVLKQYNRPFTVLDLGANNGFFSLKIAEDFDAMCVLVDNTDRLADICALNTDRNKIVYLKKRFTKQDILQMEDKEHFDVVLALLVLHHVDDWGTWIPALKRLGDNVIIETPSDQDQINSLEKTKLLARHLTSMPDAVEIGSFPRGAGANDHMLWFCQNPGSFTSSGRRHGIQPSTFHQFNGAFPLPKYVRNLDAFIKQQYGNVSWVLQGRDYSLE